MQRDYRNATSVRTWRTGSRTFGYCGLSSSKNGVDNPKNIVKIDSLKWNGQSKNHEVKRS
ncbi:MAG: hypothetical protein ACQEWV_32105 [Bacillota bacterium]